MAKGLLIPVDAAPKEIEIKALRDLQRAVGG